MATSWTNKKSSSESERPPRSSGNLNNAALGSSADQMQNEAQRKRQATEESLSIYRQFLFGRRNSNSCDTTPVQHKFCYDLLGEKAAAGHFALGP
ncbi:uncharacterized protein N7483_008426 [Penicillium malachiteum]|uniref:uncharacterized protein n=1 Tax=Penicillium malachiteum TaxID=1324776 RepID=UPI0025486E55|nr:uncharacterized protein N7483_008426 [Penicillium malachiteum]KAJ5720492.1 hypothetical protein N7483_008426 [Penicillium malachiteum]